MPTRPRRGYDRRESCVPVYILAGGRSRRFGSDKARAQLNGVPLIVRVADALRPVARRITVVAAREGIYADLELRTIGDVVEASGPIGGLLTAIDDHAGAGWIFVSACDWVGIRTAWAADLIATMQDRSDAEPQPGAILFRSQRDEPLFGLYHSAIEPLVRQQIERENLKMGDLVRRISAVTVPAPPDWERVRNVNYRNGLN